MSTNPKIASVLERQVERAVRAASSGRFDEAETLYRQVRTRIPGDPDELFQVVRAWVNTGVLKDRQGDANLAREAWQKALSLAVQGSSGPVRAAGFRAATFLALRSPRESRFVSLEPFLLEALHSDFPEVCLQIWNLFAGDPQAPLGESPPRESGLDVSTPLLCFWTRLFFLQEKPGRAPETLREPQAVQLEAFARFYEALSPTLRPWLWKKNEIAVWCRSLFLSDRSPFPVAGYEREGASFPPRSVAILQIESRSDEYVASPIRALEADIEGWTWIHEGGLAYFSDFAGNLRRVRFGRHVEKALFHRGFWHAFLDEEGVWSRGRESVMESFPGAWIGLTPGVDGVWGWTQDADVYFWDDRDTAPEKRASAGEGFWSVGWHTPAWGLVLGGQDGRLWRLDPGGRIRVLRAHQGPIVAILGVDDYLISTGEDSRIFIWEVRAGWEAPKDERRFGPVRLTAQGKKSFAFVGQDSTLLWNSVSCEWGEGPRLSKATAAGFDPQETFLAAESRGRIIAGQKEIWGWSDWPMILRSHASQNEWAVGALDGSVRVIRPDRERLEVVSLGLEPCLGWQTWGNVVVGVSPFRLEKIDRNGPLPWQGGRQESPWTAWSANGRHLVLGAWNGLVALAAIGQKTWENSVDVGSAVVAVHVDEDDVWCATRTGNFFRFSLSGRTSWQPEASFSWGRGALAGAHWSSEGLVLAWGPQGRPCLVFNVRNGRPLTSFEPTRGLASSLWDADRLWIAEGNGRLAVWEARTARLCETVLEEGEKIRRLVPTSRNIVVFFEGRRAGLIQRGGVSSFRLLEGHKGKLTAVAVSPDQAELWTGGEDGWIRRFGLPDGEPLDKSFLGDSSIDRLAFFDDGRAFAASVRGGVVIGTGPGGKRH